MPPYNPLRLELSKPGDPAPMSPDDWPELAPGVVGYAMRDGRYINLPLIIAKTRGDGRVGLFLDRLTMSGGDYRVVNVTNPKLAGMLERRGWRKVLKRDRYGERLDFWYPPERR